MIDNFEIIKEFLEFECSNDFYFIQILKRRKDPGNELMVRGTKSIKNYYIYSIEDLYKCKDSIKENCEKYNARCYMHVNKRNDEIIALHSLKLMTDCIISKQFQNVKNVYDKCCGKYSTKDKKWILDIDDVSEIKDVYNYLNEHKINVKGEIPTKNGKHIIVYPFDLRDFRKQFDNIDIHKDNPTLLYFN